MSEARIGRVLVASLHQAIADVLPMRLEFYENWLNTTGFRNGTIGLAPFSAVVSFLRLEGEAYARVMARAGRYAAEWTVAATPAPRRRLIRALPAFARVRLALREARGLIRGTYPGSRAVVRLRRGAAVLEIRGSLFCQVREVATDPLCGFYASAVARFLDLYGVEADARVSDCRAAGGKGCTLSVVLAAPHAADTAAA